MTSSSSSKLRGYVAVAADFRAGKTTPRDYLDETFRRIETQDPAIGAFVALNKAGAIEAADASTARWKAGAPLSPVDGMPVVVKDVIETADMPTGQGSPLFEGHESKRDSASVRALREAGAVIVGKTTTTEFAATHPFHTTKNPHDSERTPGGSSSGSSAAVGAGMVPAGLGTQVVGSILRPASFCGAIGFKPSVGAINRSGSHDHFSQSAQGAIGATLADTWGVMRAIADRAGGDPGYVGLAGEATFRGGKPQKLAVMETGGWGATTASAREALAQACKTLEGAGITLAGRGDDPVLEALEQSIADALALTIAINAWEGRWPLNTYAVQGREQLSASARERLRVAETLTQGDYRELIGRREAARARFADAVQRYDGFVTLAACGAAPKGLASTGNTAMNVGASLLGCPAITVPVLQDEGLPLGLQLWTAVDADAALFDLAGYVAGTVFGRADLVGTA